MVLQQGGAATKTLAAQSGVSGLTIRSSRVRFAASALALRLSQRRGRYAARLNSGVSADHEVQCTMKLVLLAFTVLILSACATVAKQTAPAVSQGGEAIPIDYRYAVQTPNGTPVDVAAYNKMVAAQGFDYYCGTGTCDQTPLLITGYAPVYPPELLASEITGSATVVFIIDETGGVADARIESATRQEFADSSLTAIKSWKFRPASLAGKPVRMASRQQFPFALR